MIQKYLELLKSAYPDFPSYWLCKTEGKTLTLFQMIAGDYFIPKDLISVFPPVAGLIYFDSWGFWDFLLSDTNHK